MRDIRLLERGYAPAEALSILAKAFPNAGGMASFVGRVRGDADVKALELSHYEPLTLAGMEEIAEAASARFAPSGLLVWHRIGTMRPGTAIVTVAAAADHRRSAIDAVDFMMDHLKCASWFWKRERRGDGWHWIEPRADDHAALARWAK